MIASSFTWSFRGIIPGVLAEVLLPFKKTILSLLIGLWMGPTSLAFAQAELSQSTTPVAFEGGGSSPSQATEESVRASLFKTGLFGWGNRLLSGFSLNGYVRNETAFRVNSPAAFTKMQNILNLDPEYTAWRPCQFRSRVRAFYDSVYDFEDIDTISPRKGPTSILTENPTPEQVQTLPSDNVRNVEIVKHDIELRELYADCHLRVMDIRAGKQIVRWGVVEGARVTDEINPLDLGEFILREVEDRYIPLWMVKNAVYIGATTLEAIWIPDLQYHKPAPRESEWEQFRFLPGLEKPASPLRDPVENFRNSEFAVRLSRLVGGWDISVSYFYTWDDFPAAFRNIEALGFSTNLADPATDPIEFRPRPVRLRIPGLALSKSLGKVVLNAEAAYVDGKVFGLRINTTGTGSNPETVTLGEIQRDYFKYAVGLDTTLWRTDVSGQVLQAYIPDYQPNIIVDQVDTVLGLFLRRNLFSNSLTAQILNLYFINDQEWLLRPRLDYSLTDQLKLSFGADIPIGTIADTGPGQALLPGEFHFVGFFTNNKRVFTALQYSF